MKQEKDIDLVQQEDGSYAPAHYKPQKTRVRFVREEKKEPLTPEQKRGRNRMAWGNTGKAARGNVSRTVPLAAGYAAVDTLTHYLANDHQGDNFHLAVRSYTSFLWWAPVAYVATTLVSAIAAPIITKMKYRQVTMPKEDEKKLLPDDLALKGRKWGMGAALLLTAFQYGNHQLSKNKCEMPFAPNYCTPIIRSQADAPEPKIQSMTENFQEKAEQPAKTYVIQPQF